MTNIDGWALVPVPLAALIVGGFALVVILWNAFGSRSDWKDRAKWHQKTLEGIAELDPAFAKVFGKEELDERYNWRQVLDGGKIQRLAAISRRKNDRQEDAAALNEALRALKSERKGA